MTSRSVSAPAAVLSSVLIVEDVATMRELLRELVTGIPRVRVSGVAANGAEARLELRRRRPELVLLDEVLPGESAWDLLAEFAQEEIPVLLVTGLSTPSAELPPGAAGRIRKPGWKTLDQDRDRFARAFAELIEPTPRKL